MSVKIVAASAAVMAALTSAESTLPAPARRRQLWGKDHVQCLIGPNGSKGAQYFHPEYKNGFEGIDLVEPGVVQLFKNEVAQVQARIDFMNPVCSKWRGTLPNIRAAAAEGAWLCGYKLEAYADPPMLKVTKRLSITKYEGYAAIEGAVAALQADDDEGCPDFVFGSNVNARNVRYWLDINGQNAGVPYRMELQWADYGEPIHGISRKRIQFLMHIFDHETEYKASDEGACTKRGDYAALLPKEQYIFTQEFAPVLDPEVECTGAPTAAPTLAPVTEMPTPEPTFEGLAEECGQPGKVQRKNAEKVRGIKEQLGGSKLAESACACKDACLAIGGTEFMWKPKKGRCRCFAGAEVVTFNSKKSKRVAGVIEGSTTEIVVKSEEN